MTLRGPSDPDAFRTQVYGARWYHDPLPGCDVAPASNDKWPSVTTVKKAWVREFTKRWVDGTAYPLDPLRVALYVDENLPTLATMGTDARVPLMATAAKRALNAAANRGTQVHSVIEQLCAGATQFAALEAGDYLDVCHKLVGDLQPEILYSEVVVFNRRLGVAGTTDAIVRIDGKTWIVDWKSRGAESNHGAYEGEAAQIGLYASGEYLIVDDNGAPKRVALPTLDGGLVVSIKPDSYETYPIDLEHAITCGAELMESWRSKREGQMAARRAIGKPIILRPHRAGSDEPAPVDRQQALKDRLAVLAGIDGAKSWVAQHWPAGVRGNGTWSAEECGLIATVLSDAEARFQAPFPDEPDPATTIAPAEPELIPPPLPRKAGNDGAPVDETDIEPLKALVADLDQGGRDLAKRWAHEAREAGRGFDQFAELRSRTLAVATAAMRCAADLYDADAPEALTRAAVAVVTGGPVHDAWPLGAVLGSLTKTRAEALTALAEAFAAHDDEATRRLGAQIAAQPGDASNTNQERTND